MACLLLFPGISGAGTPAPLAVTAAVLSKSNCRFRTATAALDFGVLDPGNAADVTAAASIDFRCMGSTPVASFSITDDDGLYESGANANRMRHSTSSAEFLSYDIALNPVTGTVSKGEYRPLVITGTVRWADYRNSLAGAYSDTVVLSIDP